MTFTKGQRREQRQAYILRELGPALRELFQDDDRLSSLFVTRVEISPDGSVCTILFSTFVQAGVDGAELFKAAKETLNLYKPSIRKALSDILHGKRTPYVKFRYDVGQEKAHHIEKLFSQVEDEINTASGDDEEDGK